MNEDLASHMEQGDSESNTLAHNQHYQEQDNLCGENVGKGSGYCFKS